MNDELIERTRRLLHGVTPGPWVAGADRDDFTGHAWPWVQTAWEDEFSGIPVTLAESEGLTEADAEFIAAAPSLVADLLAALGGELPDHPRDDAAVVDLAAADLIENGAADHDVLISAARRSTVTLVTYAGLLDSEGADADARTFRGIADVIDALLAALAVPVPPSDGETP